MTMARSLDGGRELVDGQAGTELGSAQSVRAAIDEECQLGGFPTSAIGFGPVVDLGKRDPHSVDSHHVDGEGLADGDRAPDDDEPQRGGDRTASKSRPPSLSGEPRLGFSHHCEVHSWRSGRDRPPGRDYRVIQYDVSRVIDQLLRQHEAGIKMYLVCRLGGPERMSEVYGEFRESLARGSSTELHKAPSLPAFAYATARTAAAGQADGGSELAGFDAIAWLPTPEGRPPRYAEVLDRLRSELRGEAAEALELRHARGLGVDDIAYVMGLSSAVAAQRLSEGTSIVETLTRTLDPEPAVDTLVQDAFRPRTDWDPAAETRMRARPPRLTEGVLIGGRFEVSSAAQTGEWASIYLASDSSVPGESVVLHLLHRTAPTTSARKGILRKLRLLQSVVHTSIGRILDYGWHAERLWYATPWYEGHTLEQLALQGALSPSEAIDIFAPLARALSALHEHGVVNREISSANTLILRLGTKGTYETLPLLTGFDSWLLGELSVADEPRSIAPEVAKRLAQGADPPAPTPSEDVYALALTLLDSLEPSARLRRDEAWSAFLARRAQSAVEVPDSPTVAPFAELLRQALRIKPEGRPSAAQFAAALEDARAEVAEKRARRRLLVPISALAAAVVLLIVTYFVRQSRLRLIDETLEAADAQLLGQELEAERARSRELESRLGRKNQPEP